MHTPYGISDECRGGQYMFSVMMEVRGGRGGVLESTPKMTRTQRDQQSHVLSDCQKNRHQLFSPLALEKGVSVRTHGEVGLNGRQQ